MLNNILPFFLEASFCEKIIDVSANVLCYSRRIPSKNLCFVFSYTDFFSSKKGSVTDAVLIKSIV